MKLLRRILKSEGGQVLSAALILLALGGFLVIPVLALTTTNLNANRQIVVANLELYAADAGVENVLWNIQEDPGILPKIDYPKTINIADQTINSMSSVTTTITNLGDRLFRINSIATSSGGHDTEVEVYLVNLDFSNLLEGAIMSNGELKVTNSYIDGPVYYNEDDPIYTNTNTDPDQPDPVCVEQTNWPTWDDLSPLYLSQVAGYDYIGPNPLYIDTLASPRELGPLYTPGSLTIDNGTAGVTLTLTGTLYVEGNLIFNQAQDYTIDLNGQTMFVYGTPETKDPTANAYAIYFPSNSITLTGSGCIIADGNIYFHPGMAADPTDFVLVMSLSGTTYMQPGGDFYGSLVGSAEVDLQNSYLVWTDPTDNDLNFPGMEITGVNTGSGVGTILTYTIK